MNVSDLDSIVHLLKTISPWGMLFIIVFILPIYLALWIGIVKLVKLQLKNLRGFVFTVFLFFAISLILLKIGVDRDQAKKLRAERIKSYMLSYGFREIEISRLISDVEPKSTAQDYDDLIKRFPEDFTITYFKQDTSYVKGLLLTNEESVHKINKLKEKVAPIAYTILKNTLPKDSIIAIDSLYLFDDRLNYEVGELVGIKYSGEFTIISMNEKNKLFLKRIK